ncbi:MAG: putative ABC transporter permease [Clostridia bacterium]|nr:putative ABC transporter permease [Clostridia bacterium]
MKSRKQKPKERDASTYKLTYPRLVACYLLAGFLGTVWETFLVWVAADTFELRNASFISPFNFVYGSGFVLMVLCLHRIKNPFGLFFFGGLLGGATEYLLSWAEEIFFHSRSWNYEGLFLNIQGRTTVPYMIFWGVGCLLIMRYLYPVILRLLCKIPHRVMNVLAVIATVYIAIDLTLTASVLVRYALRRSGKTALTFIGREIDRMFPEEVIHRFFPNMVFS